MSDTERRRSSGTGGRKRKSVKGKSSDPPPRAESRERNKAKQNRPNASKTTAAHDAVLPDGTRDERWFREQYRRDRDATLNRTGYKLHLRDLLGLVHSYVYLSGGKDALRRARSQGDERELARLDRLAAMLNRTVGVLAAKSEGTLNRDDKHLREYIAAKAIGLGTARVGWNKKDAPHARRLWGFTSSTEGNLKRIDDHIVLLHDAGVTDAILQTLKDEFPDQMREAGLEAVPSGRPEGGRWNTSDKYLRDAETLATIENLLGAMRDAHDVDGNERLQEDESGQPRSYAKYKEYLEAARRFLDIAATHLFLLTSCEMTYGFTGNTPELLEELGWYAGQARADVDDDMRAEIARQVPDNCIVSHVSCSFLQVHRGAPYATKDFAVELRRWREKVLENAGATAAPADGQEPPAQDVTKEQPSAGGGPPSMEVRYDETDINYLSNKDIIAKFDGERIDDTRVLRLTYDKLRRTVRGCRQVHYMRESRRMRTHFAEFNAWIQGNKKLPSDKSPSPEFLEIVGDKMRQPRQPRQPKLVAWDCPNCQHRIPEPTKPERCPKCKAHSLTPIYDKETGEE